jgi:hypothetical protein
LAAFQVSQTAIARPSIFVFNDGKYPTASALPTVGEGVFDHLKGELESRGYPSPIVSVTAEDLRNVLTSTSNASRRAVVLMTGVLPGIVFSDTVDLLTPWVRAGGLVVSGGGTIGYWSAMPGQPLTAKNVIGEKGTERLLGNGVVQYPSLAQRLGTVPSELGLALAISYNFTSDGVIRDSVFARGGQAYGWYSGVYSSVSYLPVGLGGYVIFGGEIRDEARVGLDLARLVLAGALTAVGPVESREIRLSDLPDHAVLQWDLHFGAGKYGVRLVAFDPNPDGIFFYSRAITSLA